MEKIILKIRKQLKNNADLEYKKNSYNFFREEIRLYGVRTPVVRNISKNYFSEIKDLNKKQIFSLCEELLKSGYIEESVVAFDWAYRIKNRYKKQDFKMFELWLKKYISNWGRCDDLCTHTLGYFLFKFPEFLPEIKLWARSKNRWQRRASAVSLIYSLKRKEHLDNAFFIADILLEDYDDLVQKGYGWMLKEASSVYLNDVFNFVNKNKEKMPRTALRYAIEKMPQKMKKEAMKK
ncbi:MAG: DNA alkylation repair protein [Candidatus Pacebacteria bacterium]|nr:DNA alkylation repair protein [Candidatus Paceibacterota bacterium]